MSEPFGWDHEPLYIADERTQLETQVDRQRAEIRDLLEGLTEEQARRSLVPSLTTLLGLVKHACHPERVLFQIAFEGHTRAERGIPVEVDDSFRLAPEDTIASVLAEHEQACAESRRIASAYDLDDVAQYNRRSPQTLRWVYLHLIAELARHAGHGDILREQVLAESNQASAL